MLTASTDSRLVGACSRFAGLAGGSAPELAEAMPALARGDEALPVGDGEIDRRQRACAQDRARDDDAGGGFLVDHEIGADREHRRLQHHAQDFCDRPQAAGDVAGALIAGR